MNKDRIKLWRAQMEQTQKPTLEETLEWLSKKITGQSPIVYMIDWSKEDLKLLLGYEECYELTFNMSEFIWTKRMKAIWQSETHLGEMKYPNPDWVWDYIFQVRGDLGSFDYSNVTIEEPEDKGFPPPQAVWLTLYCYNNMSKLDVLVTTIERYGKEKNETQTGEWNELPFLFADRSLAERIARAFEFAIKECGRKKEPW